MEIYSVRQAHNFLYKNNTKNQKTPEIDTETNKPPVAVFQVPEAEDSTLDFTAISPRQLREVARSSFDSGQIDMDTFATLYDGLPMHAIDLSGQVIDLTVVSDNTAFDFQGYYQEQLEIATSIGDSRTAQVLKSVVSFLATAA